MKARHVAALAGLAILAPVIAAAPAPVRAPDSLADLDDALVACRASGLTGWDLVAEATRLVNRQYTKYSCWHLWESPERSFSNCRGHSGQYNRALARLLRQLGFEVRVVHAARVQGWGHPWWQAGHTWLTVRHAGQTLDVCASSPLAEPGRIAFTPVSDELPARRCTGVGVSLALAPLAVAQIWRAWLAGRAAPRLVYRDFHE